MYNLFHLLVDGLSGQVPTVYTHRSVLQLGDIVIVGTLLNSSNSSRKVRQPQEAILLFSAIKSEFRLHSLQYFTISVDGDQD